MTRFDGAVILADVGLSAHYGGRLAALEIVDGRFFALHRGQRLALPFAEAAQLDYLQAAAALDPQPSPLLRTIRSLGAAPANEEAVK